LVLGFIAFLRDSGQGRAGQGGCIEFLALNFRQIYITSCPPLADDVHPSIIYLSLY
jgi:hypothetical protein